MTRELLTPHLSPEDREGTLSKNFRFRTESNFGVHLSATQNCEDGQVIRPSRLTVTSLLRGKLNWYAQEPAEIFKRERTYYSKTVHTMKLEIVLLVLASCRTPPLVTCSSTLLRATTAIAALGEHICHIQTILRELHGPFANETASMVSLLDR